MIDVDQPSMAMPTAVITIVRGRHRHLRAQLEGLRAGTVMPDRQVVAAMSDPLVSRIVREAALPWPVDVIDVEVPDSGRLPLARARNRAVARAMESTPDSIAAEFLVLLDVDCIPGRTMLARYRQAHQALVAARHQGCPRRQPSTAARSASRAPVLLSGPVTYLDPLPHGASGYDLARLPQMRRPHPARPAPADDEVRRAADLRLFWSLSFAMTAADWQTLGGFCEDYQGYGGEDTDFAMTADAVDGELWWVGGADAYHQYHSVQSPPVQHLDAIVRNANLFQRRWGWFPMEGWLAAFAAEGLAHLAPDGRSWAVGPDNPR